MLRTLLQMARSLLVGGAATLVDLGVLAALVELGRLPPTVANVPALLAGALVQFLGARFVVFEDAARGHAGKQAAGFLAVEAATLALNGLAFHALVAGLHVPYALARPLGTFLVFAGFSFPLWRLVFAAPAVAHPDGGATAGAAEAGAGSGGLGARGGRVRQAASR
jgi:putative flippase GtrA